MILLAWSCFVAGFLCGGVWVWWRNPKANIMVADRRDIVLKQYDDGRVVTHKIVRVEAPDSWDPQDEA